MISFLMPRIAPALPVTDIQFTEIELLLSKHSLEQSVAKRCRAILLAADGKSNVAIGLKVGLHRNSVDLLRKRFSQLSLDCLYDAQRSGKPATHSHKVRQKIVTTVCGKPPKGLSRWSCGLLAKKFNLSKTFIHTVLTEHDLHPHRLRTFNFSPDPQFEEKLLEVVGLYMNPPENALVLCMDEKTGIQALDRTQPVLPMRPGKPKQWSNEYVRHGTQTMLAAVDVNTGKATAWVNKTRKAVDFVTFMNKVVKDYPEQRLCVVMDNLNTHKGKLAQQWLEQHPQVTFHFTPTHASWVNLAECFFSILTRKGLQQAVHRSNNELKRFLNSFIRTYNQSCGPYVWTKGPEKLRKIIGLTKSHQNETHSH
jgi:transposase